MAEFDTEEFAESDMVTSFSNPNYTLGLRTSQNFMAEACTEAGRDNNGNVEDVFGQTSVNDSGDSAISSPLTDSDLASPNMEDHRGSGNSAVTRSENFFSRMQKAVNLHLRDEMQQESNVDETVAEMNRLPLGNGVHVDSVNSKNAAQATECSETYNDGLDCVPLPRGWQRHEDDNGPYYWHIKSGTIQREAPIASPVDIQSATDATSSCSDFKEEAPACTSSSAVSSHENDSCTSKVASGDGASKEYEVLSADITSRYPIRFAVRSLGWVPIAEDQLTQENSSRAVNQCIVSLSSGLRDINDVVGKWGDGKYLYMDLDQENLSLIDPHDLTVLNVQPIKSIRVWGVGRDNGSEWDFAYVARDRGTRRHMCHVFRCELPARHIANTLCEICKKVIAQRATATQANGSGQRARPSDLPNLHPVGSGTGDHTITFENLLKNAAFPTPMDEPRKIMSCHFLGTLPVSMATGVEVLNNAIETLHSSIPVEKWTYVNVTVAPSSITITNHEAPDNVIAECRIRFLSFLGISVTNVKLCAYIMHTAQEQFIAYVFHCEPSAGALSKTVEAACKLRYQKCLDKTVTSEDLLSPLSQPNSGPASKESTAVDDTVPPTDFTANLWSRAGHLKHSLASSASSVKTSTVNTVSVLRETAKYGGSVLASGAWNTGARLKDTAAVLRDSAVSTGSTLKDNFSEKAATVRNSAVITGESLKTNISDKARGMKAGMSAAFSSIRSKTESYFNMGNDE